MIQTRLYLAARNVSAAVGFALLVLTSCASGQSVAQLAGEWKVVSIDGQEVEAAEDTPYLGFDLDEKRIYGYTGCNRLTGTLKAKAFVKGHPDFSNLGMTRMLCANDEQERQFMDALNQVKTSEIADGEMQLKDGEGKVRIILRKK